MASSYKLELARFSTLLRIQDRAKCGKGGDTAQKTDILEGGDTAHTLLRWGHCTYLRAAFKLKNIPNYGKRRGQHKKSKI